MFLHPESIKSLKELLKTKRQLIRSSEPCSNFLESTHNRMPELLAPLTWPNLWREQLAHLGLGGMSRSRELPENLSFGCFGPGMWVMDSTQEQQNQKAFLMSRATAVSDCAEKAKGRQDRRRIRNPAKSPPKEILQPPGAHNHTSCQQYKRALGLFIFLSFVP